MSNTAAVKKTNGKADQPKMEVKKSVVKTSEQPVLTLEKKIQKIEDLNIVLEKHRKLNEVKQNLKKFQLGNDGLGSTVVIKDNAGNEFKTSQQLVLQTVLDTVNTAVDKKIAEAELQINFD